MRNVFKTIEQLMQVFVEYSLSRFHVFEVNSRPFWVKLWTSDVKKEDNIYDFQNSDITIGFLVPKDIPIRILRLKQSFYRVFCVLGEF